MSRAAYAMVALAGIASAALAAQDTLNAPDRSQDIAWHNAQQAYLSGLKQSDGWRTMEGGLRWRYLEGAGAGPRPDLASRVTVHYAGTLIDGTTFDSSFERGEPASFPLGRLIKAWQMAIPEMAAGDTIEIAAPADLAYGPVGKGPIPGNATLVFKVKLLGFEPL